MWNWSIQDWESIREVLANQPNAEKYVNDIDKKIKEMTEEETAKLLHEKWQKIAKPLQKHWQDKYPLGLKIIVKFGKKNRIQFIEQIEAIDDIDLFLEIQIVSEEDVKWAENELQKAIDFPELKNDWINENSFSDRRAMNERYGFQS